VKDFSLSALPSCSKAQLPLRSRGESDKADIAWIFFRACCSLSRAYMAKSRADRDPGISAEEMGVGGATEAGRQTQTPRTSMCVASKRVRAEVHLVNESFAGRLMSSLVSPSVSGEFKSSLCAM
jgi:hypothetical protein